MFCLSCLSLTYFLPPTTSLSVQVQTQKKEDQKMPCLYISTNVNLDGFDTDSIFSEATKAISSITGKPEDVSFFLFLTHANHSETHAHTHKVEFLNSISCMVLGIL